MIARAGQHLLAIIVACLAASASATAAPTKAKPSVVRIVKNKDGWQLLRNGKPYFIKGAGGDGSKALLAQAGGNSVRTWGTDKLDRLLDEAHRHGLTVTVGIWLGHERHGFNYNDADQVAAQYETARKAILRYKDHPAVLMWGLGNEMEGYQKGDNAAIWSAINNIASLAKKLDPNHPTMTVVAEIGGDRVKNIHRLCPDIDIVGINSYGGISSLPERYRKARGVKPYVVTEFGPPGVWETKKNRWGAVPEPTSTEKARLYKQGYRRGIERARGLCLGSYAFTWGNKQEATPTWFGMLLPDGTRLAAVDAMTEVWTGKPPARPCPVIESLRLQGADEVDPGATVKALLTASTPRGNKLKVRWVLQQDVDDYNVGGDQEEAPPTFPKAIVTSDLGSAKVRLPKEGGGYRLYAYIYDTHGGAAVANIPLHVKGPQVARKGRAAKLPLVIYKEASRAPVPFVPTGWMETQNLYHRCLQFTIPSPLGIYRRETKDTFWSIRDFHSRSTVGQDLPDLDGGLVLGHGEQMGVGIKSRLNLRVSETFGHDLDVDTGQEEVGGRHVSKIVEPNDRDAGLLTDRTEEDRRHGRPDQVPTPGVPEDQVSVEA
jgi:hypothetical protein